MMCAKVLFAPVAQWIEQKVSNLLVAGSIPAGGTIRLRSSKELRRD